MKSEVRVLCQERTVPAAITFLDRFLPNRNEARSQYNIPEFSESPTATYYDAIAVIDYLAENSSSTYSLYWDNQSSIQPFLAMLHFTEDGAMFAGLIVDQDSEDAFLDEMAKVTHSEYGCVLGVAPPPESAAQFIQLCREADSRHIIGGIIWEALP